MAKPDDEVLEEIANGSTVDCTLWPGLLERLLSRLDRIIHDDFPKPTVTLPPPIRSLLDQAEISTSQPSSQESQAGNKENAPPQLASTSISPPDPSNAPPSSPPLPLSQDRARVDQEEEPTDLFPEWNSIRTTLTTSFATSPPHTVQRLAELILRPRSHYRYVGPYLRAVDRVVSVSSGADSFPPMTSVRSAGLNGGGLPNGTSIPAGSGSSWNTFSDVDDSLGGALLTPVAWLRAEQSEEMVTEEEESASRDTMNGPSHTTVANDPNENDHGMIDAATGTESLRDLGAVTQGELLRQEQEAGVVPSAQPVGRQPRNGAAAEDDRTMEDEEHHPLASGPAEVGVEDVGPQEPGEAPGRFDLDVALGRKTPSREAGATAASASAGAGAGASDGVMEGGSGEQRDRDDDVILPDADAKVEADDRPNVSSS
ncbi:MAG: hypothetical protein M1816_005707 [Peltula sp. TS41687]|nr:MAG: hypothetical protein M1816_005707 [Peltula sp. TS41687]